MHPRARGGPGLELWEAFQKKTETWSTRILPIDRKRGLGCRGAVLSAGAGAQHSQEEYMKGGGLGPPYDAVGGGAGAEEGWAQAEVYFKS